MYVHVWYEDETRPVGYLFVGDAIYTRAWVCTSVGELYSCDVMSGGRDGWMSSSGCVWARVLYEDEAYLGERS